MSNEPTNIRDIRKRIYEIEHEPVMTPEMEEELNRLYQQLQVWMQGGGPE